MLYTCNDLVLFALIKLVIVLIVLFHNMINIKNQLLYYLFLLIYIIASIWCLCR